MNPLEQKLASARQEERLALIPFLTAGYPDQESFWKILAEIDANGADIIEIGVPFSDPVADGPVVEAASRRALEAGMNLEKLLAGLKARKGQFQAGIVLMGYYNPFLRHGLEKLAREAAECGVGGFIVPDLPFEESGPMRKVLDENDLLLLPLVGPNTSGERMALYAKNARGYVYVVSVMGTTGERENLPSQIGEVLNKTREVFDLPIALGFGLKNPAQLKNLPMKPDAAVFGSALLKHIENGGSAAAFLAAWR